MNETDPKWPEPAAPMPDPSAILAPLIAWVGANLKIGKKAAPPAEQDYRGFPVRLDTCDDPSQLFTDEHLRARAAKGLLGSNGAELAFLVAFHLGAEWARRSMRQRATGGGKPTRRERRPGPPRDGSGCW